MLDKRFGFLNKNSIFKFWRKIPKFQIWNKNPKFQILNKNPKISNFEQKIPKFQILNKNPSISNFEQKSQNFKFWPEISHFDQIKIGNKKFDFSTMKNKYMYIFNTIRNKSNLLRIYSRCTKLCKHHNYDCNWHTKVSNCSANFGW